MSEPGRCSVSTLLYLFDEQDRVLLMQRAQEPNLGLWSPCGGKVKLHEGESPYEGAAREAEEETGLMVDPAALHLTGLITERDDTTRKHWLMFLFEVKMRIKEVPPEHREGVFRLFTRAEVEGLAMPEQDREVLWPYFWQNRGGFFAARCHLTSGQGPKWIIEEANRRSAVPGPTLSTTSK